MKHNLLLVFSLLFLSTPALAEPLMLRSISVTGEAKEEVAPDQAILSGQLVSKEKTLKAAKEENDKQADKVANIAKQYEIPRDKISASNVYITPEYVWNQPKNKQEQVGYIVSRNLSITMDKLAIHEVVLSALVEAGIDQINNVSFSIAKPEERQDVLRIKAVQNARIKAKALAEAAGAKLGRVISITTQGASPPMPMPMIARASMAAEGADKMSVAPSMPGTNTLAESVAVVFELE